MISLQESALQLAAMGMKVFPLLPRSKQPAIKDWRKLATSDAGAIRSWWRKHPDHNIGIALAESSALAIDIDPRNGGMKTWNELIRRLGDIPQPFATQYSGRGDGGMHLIYLLSEEQLWGLRDHGLRVAGSLGPGVDVKHKGYVVGAGSIHPDSGRPYKIDYHSGVQEGLLAGPLAAEVFIALDRSRSVNAPENDAIDDEQWGEIQDALKHIPADEREEWVRVCCSLKSTQREEAFDAFVEWSAASEKFQGPEDCQKLWDSVR